MNQGLFYSFGFCCTIIGSMKSFSEQDSVTKKKSKREKICIC